MLKRLLRDFSPEVARWNLQDIGEKAADFFIGAAIERRCRYADFQCIAMQP